MSQGPGTLNIIDAMSDTVRGTVKAGTLPHWIAVTADGRVAWITNEGSNDVSIVNLETSTLVATLPVGNAPRKIVITSSAAVQTQIMGFAFAETITIVAGQTITWRNRDAVPHTVTSDDGTWKSAEIGSGMSFSLQFEKPGIYAYHCDLHPSMQRTVVVVARLD